MSREDLLKQFATFGKHGRRRTAEEVHADAMARGALCKQCSLFGKNQGPVKGEVRKNARLTIIGEAPGRVEVEQGRVFCLVPETKILHADLTWRALGEAAVGDRLLTLEEEPADSRSGITRKYGRRWVLADITAVQRSIRPTTKLTLESGELIGTDDHRVLTRCGGDVARWRRIDQLQPRRRQGGKSSRVVFFTEPWITDDSRAVGWLAGFFDGEGFVTGSKGAEKPFTVGFSQNPGLVADRAVELILAAGFQLGSALRSRHDPRSCVTRMLLGGFNESVRFLGKIRPVRLLADWTRIFETRGYQQSRLSERRLLWKQEAGEREVVDITTTAGTFIANGYVVHNCWKSGEELELALADGGLIRDDCSIVNCLECKPDYDLKEYVKRVRKNPPKDADGNDLLDPITACRPRLQNDIQESGATTLLAVGGQALEAVARLHELPYGDRKAPREGKPFVATIMNQHGAPVHVPDSPIIICSSLHPAFAMREWGYRDEVRRDIARGARIAARGRVDWDEPLGIVFPTYDQVVETFEVLRQAPRLTVDIETDGVDIVRSRIRCIGIGATIGDQQIIISVPIRWTNGHLYWPNGTQQKIKQLIIDLFTAKQLLFHNANFDVVILEREGFLSAPDVRRLSNLFLPDDSLLLDRNTRANGLPHKLGAVAKRYFECRMWKYDPDEKNADGTTDDRTLATYNNVDVGITDKLGPVLEQEVIRCGTQKTYEIDKRLAAIAREMTSMGIPIDEEYRGKLSRAYNTEYSRLRQLLRETFKRDLNPHSSDQVGNWLFDELGLEPPLNTDNKKFQEGDDWATSVPALFALLESGLSADAAAVVRLIIDCRTCGTIKSRYVNKLKTYFEDDTRDLRQYGFVDAVVWDGEEIIQRRPAISVAHSTWNVGTTPTGRWTSKPNWQNAPSRAWAVSLAEGLQREAINIRRLVRAPPGHVLVGADFDQAELKLYACIAEDEMLLDAYKNGLDAHTFNLATMMAQNANDIQKTYEMIVAKQAGGTDAEKSKLKFLRTVAKRFVFLIIYGGMVQKCISTLRSERDKSNNQQTFPKKDMPDDRMRVWYDRWHEMHPWTRIWHERENASLRRLGYSADDLHDRRRFYPDGVSNDTSHINHKVQTRSASMANDAVMQICEEIPFRSWSPWTGMIVQVHDQLVVCVPEDKGERAKKIVEDSMTSEYPGGLMRFTATAKIASNLAKQD